ncbi:hypothetical protein L3X38_012523 [Prunus dulcis]|uniref:Uncharacterized protein n=1 Tax=Prunus dulcis TaxID=3755 RepID=A0AAD4ZGG7_PRUDU|nr:hypothetical protein L3X38_012523 [Prunus dulcis]
MHGRWSFLLLLKTWLVASGSFGSSLIHVVLLSSTRLALLPKASTINPVLIMHKLSVLLSSSPQFALFLALLSLMVGLFGNWMSKMPFSMVFFRKIFTWFNLLAILTRQAYNMFISYIRPFMASSKPHGLGFSVSVTSSSQLGSLAA